MRTLKTALIVLALTASGIIHAQEPADAPINPAFLNYMHEQELLQANPTPKSAEPAKGLGYVPPLIELPATPEIFRQTLQSPKLAASYDLRTKGKVTAVRDQGSEGACWAFATYGSMESCLLTAERWDFSENNLVNLAGFDWGFSAGGNHFMSTAYLARWAGPVLETEDGYPRPGQSPTNLPSRKHTQKVIFIPKRASYTDNNAIKQAIVDYGAVYTVMCSTNGYFNQSTAAYYYHGAASPNHAVAIVGWDDNYNKSNFLKQPPGNGAFIIKNSWGTSWGASGYFYMSYYDTKVANESAVFMGSESTSNYARMYHYDPLGWVSSLGLGSTTAWAANIFTATVSENLRAVSFYAAVAGTKYEIYIYTGISAGQPRSGTLRSSKSGTLTEAGYHTVTLSTTAALTAGQRFAVVIKLTTPGYNYPLPYEFATSGYSSDATASPGQGYYSANGSTWTDLTDYRSTANFCIKAFTGTGSGPTPPPPPPPPVASGSPVLADFDGDGYADLTIMRTDGTWRFLLSALGYRSFTFNSIYSGSQYVPQPGDFDGDRYADPAVLDKSSSYWRFYSSSKNYARYYIPVKWYANGLTPTSGDFDGDRRADPIVYQASDGGWFILLSLYNYQYYLNLQWGGPSFLPVCGDFDGDRRADLMAYHAASGYWYILLSRYNYQRYASLWFGAQGFTPITGDFDGDGYTDLAIYNKNTGYWGILLSSTGDQNYIYTKWDGSAP